MKFKTQNNCIVCNKKIIKKSNIVKFKKLPITEILVKNPKYKRIYILTKAYYIVVNVNIFS